MDDWFASIFGNFRDWSILEDRTQHLIYFVECNGVYKIGTTSNIKKRLKSLQTANATPISIAYLLAIPKTYNHWEVEKALHTIFEKNSLLGEWFEISHEDIARIKLLSIDDMLNIAERMRKIKEENSPKIIIEPIKPDNQMTFDFFDDDNL